MEEETWWWPAEEDDEPAEPSPEERMEFPGHPE
jgi:hypothetical protein